MPATREWLVRLLWSGADAGIAFLSILVSTWLRFDMSWSRANSPAAWRLAIVLASVVLVAEMLRASGTDRHPRGTFEETARTAQLGVISLAVASVLVFATPWFSVPRSVPITAPVIFVLGMFALRFVIRSYRWGRPPSTESATKIIVLGAGSGGRELIRALHRDESRGQRLEPVALLDDDPRKRRWRLEGLKVVGGLEDLADVARDTGATTLAVAIPSIPIDRLRTIQTRGQALGLDVLVLPTAAQLLGEVDPSDLRSIQPEDLLGRRPVTFQADEVAARIRGKRVLVTGAGGAIGGELSRQLAGLQPASLVLADQDESALHETETRLASQANLMSPTLALCDVRRPDALRRVFDRERPDVVFHAAKLGHQGLLDRFPLEAYKTNVIGTLNVLDAAKRSGVEVFVNLSSHHAVNPATVLGWSERIAERLTAAFASTSPGIYVSVRLGRVLGTRGSLVGSFVAQIERGGPVVVSHPDAESHFMFISEACQLVLQGAAAGVDGEAMVLDMGDPLRVLDVAKSLIAHSGRTDVEIDFQGAPDSKHTDEALVGSYEIAQSTNHPLVEHVWVPPLDAHGVRYREFDLPDSARDWMQREGAGSAEEGLFDLAARGPNTSATERIYLSRADVTEVEEGLVLDALRSGWVAPLGPMVDRFEQQIADRVGVAGALALSSGTAALHLALLHAGARPGRKVVLPSMTFAASANAVLYTGAEPVFVDSRADDANVDVPLLLEAVRKLEAEGEDVAAIMTVDLFGRCADYTALQQGIADLGVPLIEDAAEALGAKHDNRAAGSFGQSAALSFNGNKIMTTSGGGMLLSNDEDLLTRARYLSTQARQPAPWYEHTEMGFNYRMSNLLAALGVGQLSRLDSIIARRRAIRRRYIAGLGDLPAIRFLGGADATAVEEDNCWLTCITLDAKHTETTCHEVIDALASVNIEARHLWKPMHLQPLYANSRSFLTGASQQLFESGVTLPSGSELTDSQIDRVIDVIRREFEESR